MSNQLRRLGRALALTWIVGLAAPASAQSVRLDQYRAAETPEDGFAVSRPDDLGHLRFGARLDLDYVLNPLVYQFRASDPGTEVAPIVEHLLAMNVGLSFGLADRIVIFAGMPFNLVMEGVQVAGQPRADGSSIGDVYLGVRGRLFGEAEDAFALSVQVTGTAPTAEAARFQSRFAGEGNFTIQPELLMEVRIADIVRVTGNIGVLVRESQDFGSLRVGHELTWALGVYAALVQDVLDLAIETFGASSLDSRFGEGNLTPWEIIGGFQVQPVSGLRIGASAGTGMVRGYGAGDFRGVLTVGYATPGEAGDRDQDGITDDRDECPDEPEDVDQFEDENGCPDPDNDRDGVNDPEDQCDDQPEDADGIADDDGCPEEDADGDSVPDTADRCPTEPGVQGAARPECEGCPSCDEQTQPTTEPGEPVQPVSSGDIPDRVYFETGNDTIRPSEQRALDNVAQYLAANPGARIVIEGHADVRGEEPMNVELSANRARRVSRRLAARGVDRSRMVLVGCGEAQPADSNDTRPGRQANRRVEFRLVGSGEAVRSGCVEVR